MSQIFKLLWLSAFLLSTAACSEAAPAKGEKDKLPLTTKPVANTNEQLRQESTTAPLIPTEKQPKADRQRPLNTAPLEKKSVRETTKTDKIAPPTVTNPSRRIHNNQLDNSSVQTEAENEPPVRPPSHQIWDQLLQQYVDDEGRVDYEGFLQEQNKLETYLKQLANHPPQSNWGRAARLAYWINAYNAFTVQLILNHYPVSSIRAIFDGRAWDKEWIQLGGKSYSLNEIEHEIIRKHFDEARIHFVVNCAARSCPPLPNQALTADKLENMLEQYTRQFINNPAYNKINTRRAAVSKIFDWYKEDFDNVNRFIARYASEPIDSDTPITYLEYDWALNQQ